MNDIDAALEQKLSQTKQLQKDIEILTAALRMSGEEDDGRKVRSVIDISESKRS